MSLLPTRTRRTKPNPLRAMCKELQEPIYEPPLNALMGSDGVTGFDEDRAERIRKARYRKVELLYQHYGIARDSPTALSDLAVRLAFDFVPGLAVVITPPAKPGRPLFSTKDNNWALAMDIEELALRKPITQFQACTLLHQRRTSPWYGKGGEGSKGSNALYGRYRRQLERNGETAERRLAYLRERLARERAAPRSNNPEAPLPLNWDEWPEEPIRRILDAPNGTKTP